MGRISKYLGIYCLLYDEWPVVSDEVKRDLQRRGHIS